MNNVAFREEKVNTEDIFNLDKRKVAGVCYAEEGFEYQVTLGSRTREAHKCKIMGSVNDMVEVRRRILKEDVRAGMPGIFWRSLFEVLPLKDDAKICRKGTTCRMSSRTRKRT
uniref:Uncharacterized protein n=1 Tax=Phaseolus vulgaris TaxID=3885 RepID=D2DWA0_PHAVU|nr:hypothetical protein [Phaseolus vulgaris]